MKPRSFFLLLFGLVPVLTNAAGDTLLRDTFELHFRSHYRARQCGQNCLSFASAIKKGAGDASCLLILAIENRGISVFGMVNAEATRGNRFNKPAVVEANWYHHVVVMDASGLVYDFDFTTEPRVLPMRDYLEQMFLDEPECKEKKPQIGEFCAGRDRKLADYEVTIVNAEQALTTKRPAEKKVFMKVAHEDWRSIWDKNALARCRK